MAAHHLRSLLESFLNILNLEATAEAPIPDSIIPESVSLLPREQLVLPVAMSEGGVKVEGQYEVAKADDEHQLIFGWASVAVTKDGEELTDAHDEVIAIEDLELPVYDFVLKGMVSGEDHVGAVNGRLVESIVFTPDKLEKLGLKNGDLQLGWWIGVHIPDHEAFERAKTTKQMFSIEGTAVREPLDE